MSGDYSRNSDQPHQRFSGLFMQQGRVQIDADWNESVEILRRRIREEANDIFGAAGVPRETTPNGFQVAWTGSGASADLTISPGRIYVDGILAEYFADETFTYAAQPFLPNPPPLAKFSGSVLVYLDVWEREITAVEDPSIVDPALNGVDTGTRLKTIWQVKIASAPAGGTASCVTDFSSMFPPSGGRLTATTIPQAQAPDPCTLPAAGGYQGVDNRFYRVQVHDATNLLIKWSRDNGSVATAVTAINNAATSADIKVANIGADDDLSFHVGDWVEVIDDAHELSADGPAGVMANVKNVDAAHRVLTLDRSLASANFNPASNTVRVRRWDQTQGLSGTTGLIQVTPGTPVTLENGIEVTLTIVPGGALRVGDAWVFAARVATGQVDPLNAAPPIAIRHHYASLATFSGLGGAATPTRTDCRVLWPPIDQGTDCSCTVCVDAADHNAGTATIQQAIYQVIKAGGGTVCLGPGVFNLTAALAVAAANGVTIRGMGGSTLLISTDSAGITVTNVAQLTISDLVVACTPAKAAGVIAAIGLANCLNTTIERTSLIALSPQGSGGNLRVAVGIGMSGYLAGVTVRRNEIWADYGILGRNFQADAEKALTPDTARQNARLVLWNLQVEENVIVAGLWGIVMGGIIAADLVSFARNIISAAASARGGIGFSGTAVTPLRITANDLQVDSTATAIAIASDDFVVTDNIIGPLESGAGGAVGISIEAGPSEGQVRGAIERNRIAGTTVAVNVSADATRLTLRDNVIDKVDGGIILTNTASVDDLVIEGNEITNVGATSTTTSLGNGFAGIAVIGASHAVIRNNTLSTVGSANTSGVGVLGIGVSQPGVVSIVENDLRAIGSLAITTAQTYGIRVVGPFDDARVVGNRVEAAQPSTGSGSTLAFTGISVTNPQRNFYPGLDRIALASLMLPPLAPALAAAASGAAAASPPPPTPAVTITQTAVQPLLFQLNASTSTPAAASARLARKALGSLIGDFSLTNTPDPIVITSTNQQAADVSGNKVDVVPSMRPLIEAEIVGSCLLRSNRATLTTASSATTPAAAPGTIMPASAVFAIATVLIASDNVVNAYAGVTGLALSSTKATILGNISTSGITYGGVALAPPWNTLNGG